MFHKQKTTKITLNFPKIIEMHLNSSSQCIQLAMRQVNKREKTQLRQREKLRTIRAHSEIRTHDPRRTR
jgi:hypothetical protein